MRIAILGSRGYPSTYGGYETLVRHLARHAVQAGHDVTVYCRGRENMLPMEGADLVQRQWTRGWDSKAFSTLSYGLTSHFDCAWHRKADVAIVLNVANGFFLPAMKWRGIPTIVNTDGIEWERGKWGPVAKAVFRRGAFMTAKYADRLVADSRAIREVWLERFGVDSEFIPYGGDDWDGSTEGLESLNALGLEPGSYNLVVARAVPENNVELVLDAVEQCGLGNVVVVGDSPSESPIRSRLRQLNAAEKIMWLGHVNDQQLLHTLWAQCAVYIHGHSVGGTNPALLQALGAGAPTLALNTVYNREVLGDGDQLFERNAADLAVKSTSVFRDPEKQQELRARGKKIVESRYRWRDVCEAYLELASSIARNELTDARGYRA